MNISLRAIGVSLLLLFCSIIYASIPILDTIILKPEYVEGRWVEKQDGEKDNIYIFRSDNTFHKASDSGELLFFNIAGRYTLSNDSIKIFYQDFSRQNIKNAKVKTMHMRVVALSEDELNIYETKNSRTQFIRLRRQK